MTQESTTSQYLDLNQFCEEAAASYPSNRLYCLADHAGMPGLHRELVRRRIPWISLFEGSKEDAALAVAPLLFALHAGGVQAESGLLRWVSEHGTFTSSILLLSSPLAMEELTRPLTLRMRARVSEDMDVLLRYFDPRVFEALLEVFTPSQREAFLGVADCWWYVNRRGEVVRQPAEAETCDTFESPLLLSASQEFALLDRSEIDQVASQLRLLMPDHYLRLNGARRADFLRRHIDDAKAAGIDSTHELSLYCGLALLHGDDFALAPHWQRLLADVRARHVDFAEAVAALEE